MKDIAPLLDPSAVYGGAVASFDRRADHPPDTAISGTLNVDDLRSHFCRFCRSKGLSNKIATGNNADTKRIAIFLDDDELIAPVARAWIRDGQVQITGNFSREEARTLAIQLESGRLPVALELVSEEVR